jgi:hypothetical protein
VGLFSAGSVRVPYKAEDCLISRYYQLPEELGDVWLRIWLDISCVIAAWHYGSDVDLVPSIHAPLFSIGKKTERTRAEALRGGEYWGYECLVAQGRVARERQQKGCLIRQHGVVISDRHELGSHNDVEIRVS